MTSPFADYEVDEPLRPSGRETRFDLEEALSSVVVLQARVPMVLVPFAEAAESEQTLRARLLTEAGVAQMVEADALDPVRLARAIDRAQIPPPLAVDLDGARKSARMILQMVADPC